MGKKHDILKGIFTWKKEEEYLTSMLPEWDGEPHLLVELKNGNVFKGRYSKSRKCWYVCSIQNDSFEVRVSLENPVVEWCFMPFEREEREE